MKKLEKFEKGNIVLCKFHKTARKKLRHGTHTHPPTNPPKHTQTDRQADIRRRRYSTLTRTTDYDNDYEYDCK